MTSSLYSFERHQRDGRSDSLIFVSSSLTLCSATTNGIKRRHDDSYPSAAEPPRQKPKITDKDVIVIDPPSPPAVDDSPALKSPTPPLNGDAKPQEAEGKLEENKDDVEEAAKISKQEPQQEMTELITAKRHLRALRANVCKLLRLLVPELELDDGKEAMLEDTTVDELLQQVLAANTQA